VWTDPDMILYHSAGVVRLSKMAGFDIEKCNLTEGLMPTQSVRGEWCISRRGRVKMKKKRTIAADFGGANRWRRRRRWRMAVGG